jgi:predicted alpha/beta superfamily hydrolase
MRDELQTLPAVGPSIARDLRDLGITSVKALSRRDPERLYAALNRLRGVRQDPCVLYTFRCAIYAARTARPRPNLLKWWNWKGRTLLLALAIGGVTPLASQATPPGEPVSIATSYTIPSKVLGQIRRINIYLPPGYETSGQRYPVLYLLDGGIHEDFLHVVGIASLAADFRKIRPFVVVGVEGIDRYHDLIYPTTIDSQQLRLPTSGGAATFRSFLATELKPWVESHFRLTDETVLMGESAAGLFVVETLLRQPELFRGYIAVSPSLWWDDQSLSKAAPPLLARRPFPPGRQLYLTIADEGGEMREGVDRLVEALREAPPPGLEWTFVAMEQETHGTTFHPAALAAVRKFFAMTE